jgi:tetratricopeptide (TPR) repeat protein
MMNKTLLPNTGMILAAVLLSGCAATLPQKEAATDVNTLAQEADTAYQRGDLAESGRLYTRLTRAAPDVAVYWYRLGNSQAGTGQPYAAIKTYAEALSLEPGMTAAWYNMGMVQLRLAAHTFHAMQAHAKPADPLTARSRAYLEGILKLINEEPAKGGEAQTD